MQHTNFGRPSAHTQRITLGRFFCAITLLGMLIAAALPTVGAYAQDVETQTPTATIQPNSAETAIDPTGAPVDASATTTAATNTAVVAPSATTAATATPVETQNLDQTTSSPQVAPSATPVETQTLAPQQNLASPTSQNTATASPVKLLLSLACQSGEKTADVKLDGITLSICAPVLPGAFVVPDPSSSDQVATAATFNPYQEFSITAVPYGLKVSSETLPTAAAGLAVEYLQDLKNARTAQGGQVTDGPAASIFGSSVSSIASLVSLNLHGDALSKVVIVEWVADAGKRLWIIRYSQEVTGAATITTVTQPLTKVIVSSTDITGASTSAKYFAAPNPPPPGSEIVAQAAGDYPTPSWWSGDCDKNNFPGSYALGGIYKGVKACGPINTEHVIQFAPGLWGELEWQCVELSMRFMYLAYGVLPYSGNGNQVVSNYKPKSTDRVQLVKIYNDTVGKPPVAGDILSYGITMTYGHTSVVTGSNVDNNGNGTVSVIQQNIISPSNGMQTLTVANWHVYANYAIYGWLHGNNPIPTLSSIKPTNTMAGTQGQTVIAYGSNFLNSSTIRWNGASLVTAFVNSTELIAAVPDSDITTGTTASITVKNPSPGGGTSSTMIFTVNNPVPALTSSSLSPSSALIAGSSLTLTVTGSNFVKTSKVLWNNTTLSTTFVSGTQLTASVPSSDLTAAGTVNVTVSNPAPAGGTSGAQPFIVNYRVPTLTSLSPGSVLADANGLTLTVNGTNFVAGSIVRWNGANLTTTYASGTKLTALVPSADLTQAAAVPIIVFNPSPGGGPSAASLTFNVNNPVPTTTSLAPDHLTAGTSTFTLTVTGTNFVPTSTVRWNGGDLATTYVSATQLKAQVTAALATNPGWMNVTVFNPTPAGGATVALIFKVISQTPGVCVPAKNISLSGSDTNNNSTTGSTSNIDSYPVSSWDSHGPEYTYLFTTAQPATVAVNIWDNTANLKVFLIDGGSGSCNAANALAYGTKVVFNAQANHNYYFVVDGYQGAAGSYRITVNAFSPTDGSQIQTARPIFQWPAIEGAKTYSLQVSNTSNFASLLLIASTSSTSYAVGTAFPSNQLLYWRIKTNTGSYIYMPKGYLSFQTGNPPSTPKLSSPSANALTTSYTPLIDWSDSTLPSGVTLTNYQLQVSTDGSFTTASLIDTTTGQSNYQVSSPVLAPNTKYYWRVQAIGSNGASSNWTSVSYFRAAMLAPSLAGPANATAPALVTFRPTFSWNAVTGASGYTIQISKINTFISTLVNTKVSVGTSYIPTSDLPLNTQLYWRVEAEGTNGPSLWSPVWTFTSANPPSTPKLSSPVANATVTSYTPLLDWSDSTLPAGVTLANYQLQVSTDATFTATSLIDTTTSQSNYQVSSPALASNTKYYWRVRAYGSNQHYSNWSAVSYFNVTFETPVLLLPTSGSIVTTTTPTFQWSSVNGAISYNLKVSSTSNFTVTTLKITVTSPNYTPTTALPAHTKLYWRVQANNANGSSAWTTVISFTTP
ncbi:MAG: CHAP domain-containing protein [Anaerolineaceae bacterium]|nr:CHAP domain-containing protein [Anaerolineaceae bacterium]